MAERSTTSRRSFLARVAGGIAIGATATITGAGPARALQRTDNDRGRHADPRGQGQREYDEYTGITDSDGGAYADRAGHGRRPRTGNSDSDSGSHADPAGHGAPYTGRSDSDGGSTADRAGHGRRGDLEQTGITDSDSGGCSDPAGRGRGGRRSGCPQ